MKHIYRRDYQVNNKRYPELILIGVFWDFYSSDFQLISERDATIEENARFFVDDAERAAFWKLQGDILGSMV